MAHTCTAPGWHHQGGQSGHDRIGTVQPSLPRSSSHAGVTQLATAWAALAARSTHEALHCTYADQRRHGNPGQVRCRERPAGAPCPLALLKKIEDPCGPADIPESLAGTCR